MITVTKEHKTLLLTLLRPCSTPCSLWWIRRPSRPQPCIGTKGGGRRTAKIQNSRGFFFAFLSKIQLPGRIPAGRMRMLRRRA